jgi:hypothetical protein
VAYRRSRLAVSSGWLVDDRVTFAHNPPPDPVIESRF